MVNVQDIHCDTPDCKRFLARVNGDRLEIWCPKCKTFHPVQVVDIVAKSMSDLRNGHEQEGDTKLLW